VTHAAQPDPGDPGRAGEGGVGTPLRVHAAFVGCKVSQADSEAVLARLAAYGCRAVADPAQADVLLLMTCGVTGEAERSSRQLARRLAGHGRPVVVAGCAAALRPEQFSDPGISVAPATDGRAAAADAVALQMLRTAGVAPAVPGVAAVAPGTGGPGLPGADRAGHAADPALYAAGGPELYAADPALPAAERDRTRFTLKVQDGCAGRCSYCAVRLARGAPWSLAADAAVARARDSLDAGCGEIVLSGIDVGAYRDGDGADLAALVRRLVALPRLARLRLSSIEPAHLTADLLQALAHPLVARHLHVPLQSADDGVLAAMRRPYTWGQYRAAVAAARRRLPGLALSTDLIVGFPGEDDDAFARSLAALTLDGGLFERVHVFPYSRRSGTEAAALESLPVAVVKARARLARAAAAAALRAAAAAALGAPARVLVEEERDGVWRGYSSTYVRYYLRGDAVRGRMVDAVGDSLYRDGVRGQIV
jgi:threonylcarbamoyladenosine tRNA methylthiotransferase MtaB